MELMAQIHHSVQFLQLAAEVEDMLADQAEVLEAEADGVHQQQLQLVYLDKEITVEEEQALTILAQAAEVKVELDQMDLLIIQMAPLEQMEEQEKLVQLAEALFIMQLEAAEELVVM